MYMHLSSVSENQNTNLPTLPCFCGSMRRTARALTQVYEKALAPTGLTATQMTILQVLARVGEARQGRLGEILAMDSTSLTRTLAVMRRKGWIAERRGTDRRERWLSLNTAGKRKLQSAEPIWQRVQWQVRREFGDDGWGQLMGLTQRLTVALAKQDRVAERRKRRQS
jgi:DNA-binding MarR family transcriptional regulator